MSLRPIKNFLIRPFKMEDKQQIVDLWLTCDLFTGASAADAENEFTVASMLPSGQMYVAEDDGEVIAVVFAALSEGAGWIWDLCVHPHMQGQGIGKAMVRKAENWAKAQGASRTLLFMQKETEDVRKFYEAISYTHATDKVMHKTL